MAFLKNATGDGSNADFAILGGRDRGAHSVSALFEAAVVDEVDDEYDEFAAQLPADRERNLAEIREKRLGEFCELVVNCLDRTGLVRVLEDELESVEFTHQIIEDMCATAGGEAVRGVLDAIIRDTCVYVRPDSCLHCLLRTPTCACQGTMRARVHCHEPPPRSTAHETSL